MIIKNVGKKLIFDTKLYVLLYRLSPIMILISPWLFLLFNHVTQINKFQEPTLRTQLVQLPNFDTKQFDSLLKINLFQSTFHNQMKGIWLQKIKGLYDQELLMITFKYDDNNNYQKALMHTFAHLLSKEQHLIKDVILLGYKNTQQLAQWLDWYQIHGRWGFIRAAINLDLAQKSGSVYFKHSANGATCDSDYYFSIHELLTQLNIKFKPCEHPQTRSIRSIVRKVDQLLGINWQNVIEFVQNQICTLYDSKQQGHSVLLNHGVQAATIKSNPKSKQKPIEQLNIMRLLVSWIRVFSLQEDNLHSSYTLWHKFENNKLIPLKFYIIPNIIFLAFVVIKLLYEYYTTAASLNWHVTDVLFVVVLSWTIFSLDLFYVSLLVLVIGKIINPTKNTRQLDYYRYILAGTSVLMSVYTCIYYLIYSFIGSLITCMILMPRKVSVMLVIAFVAVNIYLGHQKWFIQNMRPSTFHLLCLPYLAFMSA